MRVVTVIQARIRSSRLPAKILLDLAGRPVLAHVVARARRIARTADIVVATSLDAADDLVVDACHDLDVRVVRGSQDDVLARYVLAARETGADAVVRITADCPLLDPAVSSAVVGAFLRERPDYASNVIERHLPRGLDTEVVSVEALLRANEGARGSEREHVTQHIYGNRDVFHCLAVRCAAGDLSALRWTLDTVDDYRFLSHLVRALGSRAHHAQHGEILAAVLAHPWMARINAAVEQKAA